MSSSDDVRLCCTRRGFVTTTLGVAAAGAASLMVPDQIAAETKPSHPSGQAYNGSTDPYPLPWLDKFGDHNQPAGDNLDPSDIFHFKGKIIRCANFSGMGTDNKGNRIAFGAPSTDFAIMHGEYWAARAAQQGSFAHL